MVFIVLMKLYHRFSHSKGKKGGKEWNTFNDDGSAIVEFLIDGLNEITWWILSYGDRVQVLAPKILRQRIIEIAQKMVNANVKN